MDADQKVTIEWEPFVGQGFIGGSLAGLTLGIGVALWLILFVDTGNLAVTILAPPLLGAVLGAMDGLLIGYVLYWWSNRHKKVPKTFDRILIGSVSLFVFLMLVSGGSHDHFLSMILNLGQAVLIGGVSGYAAHPRSSSSSNLCPTEQALGAESSVSDLYSK